MTFFHFFECKKQEKIFQIFNHVPSSSSSNAMKTSSKVFEFDRVYEPHTQQGNQFLSNP